MGTATGDAALLQATLDRPEEVHTADEGTRSAIEEQLMAYLTVRSRAIVLLFARQRVADCVLQANSDHLSSYLTSQRVSNMLDVSLQVPITPQV
jgi:hypothetical protein